MQTRMKTLGSSSVSSWVVTLEYLKQASMPPVFTHPPPQQKKMSTLELPQLSYLDMIPEKERN